MLRPEKALSVKKLYCHNILRLLVAMVFWAVAYELLHGVLEGNLTRSYLATSVRDVLLFRHEFHLYYLPLILLVYVWLPVTRLIVASGTKRQLEYALLCWFVLGILSPTLRNFWPWNRLQGIPVQWMLNMSYAAIGYGMLGYYLWHWNLGQRHKGAAWLLVIAGFGITYGGVWWMSVGKEIVDARLWEGMSLGPACLAAGLFMLGCSADLKPHDILCRCCGTVSRASFGIYLSHVMFLELLKYAQWLPTKGTSFFGIPAYAILILLCSYGLWLVLRRIPVVNRWLI